MDGWIVACEAANESPVPMLAQVATNLLIEPTARWRAAKRLREFANEPIGQRALESCLIESLGRWLPATHGGPVPARTAPS